MRRLECAAVAFVTAAAAVVAGCGAPGGRGVWQQPGQGMEVNIFLQGPDAKYARWASGPGDELRFAGGTDAGPARWSWQGVLSDEQVAAIDAMVTDARWFTQVPVGDEKGGDTWEITVASPKGRNSFTVHGHEASVAAVWGVFNKAGLARFDADERLVPRPDLDTFVQTRHGEPAAAAGRTDGQQEGD